MDIILPAAEADESPGAEYPTLAQANRLNDAAMHLADNNGNAALHAGVSMLRRALRLHDLPAAWSNLGLLLWRMNDLYGAQRALQAALDRAPNDARMLGNMGVFQGAMGNLDEARRYLLKAARIEPDNMGPRWDMCLLDLRSGNWERGLKEYDVRREHRGKSLYPPLPAPFWRGEDLTGKTLYIQGEQGLGDRFLFSRYFAWIKQCWPDCKLLICLHDSLVNLFWEFRGLVEFMPEGVPWPKVDYATFLCSLPEIHGTRQDYIPDDPGLLLKRIRRAQQKTKASLPEPYLPSLKVGLVWTGNSTQTRNRDRSVPLELMMQIAEDPRIMAYSFQCSPGQQDIARYHAGDLLCDIAPQLEQQGWVGTGLALMEMDLVITVCTSVAHLAGALRVPCWTLLCADPYWIWGRTGSTTPWYPGMRLFRQRTLGDWLPVISDVRTELAILADKSL